MIRMPHTLRVRGIGGSTFAGQARKTNFLAASPGFLLDVANELGLSGSVKKHPGCKAESGQVLLESPGATVRLYEDPVAKNGLVLECLTAANEPSAPCRLSEVKSDIEIDDWCWRVSQMLNRQP